jgi:hypothetical protein
MGVSAFRVVTVAFGTWIWQNLTRLSQLRAN